MFIKWHTFRGCQVVRVILLWVNNHFRDFEMLPDMADILDKFSSLLEENVCTCHFISHYPGKPGYVG